VVGSFSVRNVRRASIHAKALCILRNPTLLKEWENIKEDVSEKDQAICLWKLEKLAGWHV
jgi:hypothetical protein